MSYRARWFSRKQLVALAVEIERATNGLAFSVNELVDRDSEGRKLSGAFGANIERKLRIQCTLNATIMDLLS